MAVKENFLEDIIGRLKQRIGEEAYASWLAVSNFRALDDQKTLLVELPTSFIAGYVKQHYGDVIAKEGAAVLGYPVKLTTAVVPGIGQPQEHPEGGAVPPAAIFRPVVRGGLDEQPDFFIPDVSEVPLKDDVSLMQVTPFTIQSRGETRTRLVFELKNNQTITVAANPDYGLPTAFDYDIVLLMQSTLMGWANLYRAALKNYEDEKAKGKDVKQPLPPPRYFEPTASEIVKFMRAEKGGNTFERLRSSLNRLANTRVELEARHPKKKTIRIGSFPLIDTVDVTAESETGQIQRVRIGIPNWVYDGIVERTVPTVLTYSRDYLRLKQPFLRAVYRLLRPRLPADGSPCEILTKELHHLVASRQTLKEFHRELGETVKRIREHGGYLGIMLEIKGERATRRLVAWKQDGPKVEPEPSSQENLPLE